jgi:death-on-curing protein
MRYLSLEEVLDLHQRIILAFGGASGVRDLGALQSAVAQPRMTFAGQDLYATLTEKAAALCYSLAMNHPFVDGNKRVAHYAMEMLLFLNGHELAASVSKAEALMLKLAAGAATREELVAWISAHTVVRP